MLHQCWLNAGTVLAKCRVSASWNAGSVLAKCRVSAGLLGGMQSQCWFVGWNAGSVLAGWNAGCVSNESLCNIGIYRIYIENSCFISLGD